MMVPKDMFLVHIVIDDLDDDGEDIVIININTVKCWKEHRHLCDHYTEEEADALYGTLDELNISELQESVFESDYKSIEEARESLLANGFSEDKDFSSFINSMSNE